MIRPVLLLAAACAIALAANPDGEAIYKQRCAMCHDQSSETRAPAPAALRHMAPEGVVKSLESGLMKQQGAALTVAERISVAEFLTAKRIGQSPSERAGMCTKSAAVFSPGPGAAAWNGWSVDVTNARLQSAAQAKLEAADVPKLKLKWAFAFRETFVANGQPSIIGGRVFVASANRNIYSLDANTGCEYWEFQAEAPVRTAISVAALKGSKRNAAFFGDQRGNAYAIDASNGELLWKTRVDEHPKAKIVGAPTYYDGRLYVPVTAGEEGPQIDPKYECCSGRGAIMALDAATGKQIWKTYTIAEQAKPTGKNWAGATMWGPSGASIWSAPTIDADANMLYATTGDNFSEPATKTSDAVIAFELNTGKIAWVKQLTENDVFNMGCMDGQKKAGCPDPQGPDFDFGASPILVKLASGKRVLLLSQKSGYVHGVDPDRKGEILWQTKVGRGGALGGLQWGSASDGKNVYAAVSDITFVAPPKVGVGGMRLTVDPEVGGGLFALDVATGAKVWAAPKNVCGGRSNCSPAQSAAVSAIPGAVFSGGVDGHLRAYSTVDGSVIWDYDTTKGYSTVNGITTKGGSMDGPGPTIVNGMVFAGSGYGAWGGLPGNVLLAFSVDGR